MSELVGNASGSKYSDEQRINAAVIHASTGVYSRTSEQTGIPDRTLRDWGNTDWWNEVITEVREQNKEKRIAQYDEIMDLAHTQVVDKLPDSSARDAMIIMATAQDKGRILQQLPNAYRGGDDTLADLKERFRAIEREHRRYVEIDASVVANQNENDSYQAEGPIQDGE